jgi:hypothetical protein
MKGTVLFQVLFSEILNCNWIENTQKVRKRLDIVLKRLLLRQHQMESHAIMQS